MTDTPLTDDGILEAKTAGKLIGNEEIKFDAVYTSLLRRSIKTVWMVLQEIGSFTARRMLFSTRSFIVNSFLCYSYRCDIFQKFFGPTNLSRAGISVLC